MAKKKVSKGVKRRVTLVIGPISIGIFCLTLITILSYTYRINKLTNTKKELEERLAYLQESAENMSNEIVKLKDPEYIAKYARENYYYTKNGEYVLKIVEEKEEKTIKKDTPIYVYYIIGIVSFITVIGIFIIKKTRE